MLFTDIDYLTSDFEIAHGFVEVTDGRISYVGKTAPGSSSSPVASSSGSMERYDGRGKLLMPGFYNAHAHAPMTLLRGYAESLSLHDWLNTRVFPFEAKIDDEKAYPATMLAIAEMLRFGIVSFSDMYFFSDARARAVIESGIKANICENLTCFDPSVSYEQLPNKAIDDHLISTYHNSYDQRLKIELSIHAEYSTTPLVVEAVGQAAVDHGVSTHIHLSESRSEHEECKQRHGGKSPAQYFDSLGFFRQPCTAAHCVWTEPEDWEIFRNNQVTVSCCPASNMKLASGFAPVPQMLFAGVNVALGTDGMASNNSHNMFRDLYLLALLYKGFTGDPTVVTPVQALKAATINGAFAQRRLDCGAIEVGNRADLVVLDVDVPWMQPAISPLNNLAFSVQGNDVVLTMVDGKVLYRNGEWKTIDVERAARETSAATRDIMASL